MEEKAKIRHAVLVEGKSQREMSRETGYSRNTIKRMVSDSECPKYEGSKKRVSPVLGPYKGMLEKWVEEDSKKVKKKRRTATRMYQILKEEHGYEGSEPTIRVYVGKLRKGERHKVYVPLAYSPGETGQVDFGEAEVEIGGEEVVAQLFVMWLGYSGATYVQAYPAQPQEVFFAGHVSAFEFFGGVPREIWYDNLASAVRKVLKGSKREESESFISFRTHYLYRAEYCNVASGWEKGGVEGRVGYVRRNWLIGAGGFASWEELNEYLAEKCREEMKRTLQGRNESIGERLAEEQEAFLPLPNHPYRCCKTMPVSANQYSLVTYATNRYSVPVSQAHEALTLHAYVERIEISCGAEIIAVHKRCWGRREDQLNPYHYLPLLAQRPRAFAHAKPIRGWQQEWPAIFDTYFALLKEKHPLTEATRCFIEVLKLGERYSEAELASALDEAVTHRCLRVSDICELLRRSTEVTPPQTTSLAGYPTLTDIQVEKPTLDHYDQLLPWSAPSAAEQHESDALKNGFNQGMEVAS